MVKGNLIHYGVRGMKWRKGSMSDMEGNTEQQSMSFDELQAKLIARMRERSAEIKAKQQEKEALLKKDKQDKKNKEPKKVSNKSSGKAKTTGSKKGSGKGKSSGNKKQSNAGKSEDSKKLKEKELELKRKEKAINDLFSRLSNENKRYINEKLRKTVKMSHSDVLNHHGILGMRWGVRNTPRYSSKPRMNLPSEWLEKKIKSKLRERSFKSSKIKYMTNEELLKNINRVKLENELRGMGKIFSKTRDKNIPFTLAISAKRHYLDRLNKSDKELSDIVNRLKIEREMHKALKRIKYDDKEAFETLKEQYKKAKSYKDKYDKIFNKQNNQNNNNNKDNKSKSSSGTSYKTKAYDVTKLRRKLKKRKIMKSIQAPKERIALPSPNVIALPPPK